MHSLSHPSHVCSLHKVLFTEQPETYYKWDNWPPESDRKWDCLQEFPHGFLLLTVTLSKWFFLFFSFFLRLCSEVPLLEDTLMRILVIGLSRDLPLGPADAMELADHLVKRAAGVQCDGMWRSTWAVTVHGHSCVNTLCENIGIFNKLTVNTKYVLLWFLTFAGHRSESVSCLSDLEVLRVERIQLIDAVLNLCTYHHPENIQLPAGYIKCLLETRVACRGHSLKWQMTLNVLGTNHQIWRSPHSIGKHGSCCLWWLRLIPRG